MPEAENTEPSSDDITALKIGQALSNQRLEAMEKLLSQFISSVDSKYVNQDQFRPVRIIVYSMAGAIGMAFIGAVISKVIV